MPILPMISATKTLDKVLCLAADIKHSSFDGGQYNICNDIIEHKRVLANGSSLIYQPVPFTFNIPAQSETDSPTFGVTNVGLISSSILKAADNSLEDITIKCWLIVANYDGSSSWIELGEYTWDTLQTETMETVTAAMVMKNCYQINIGKYRGKNPNVFINLNHR